MEVVTWEEQQQAQASSWGTHQNATDEAVLTEYGTDIFRSFGSTFIGFENLRNRIQYLFDLYIKQKVSRYQLSLQA